MSNFAFKYDEDADIFAPKPPAGYASMPVSASQILLPLTISNKCGQAFRWRGIKVWEPISESSSSSTKLEDLKDIKSLASARIHGLNQNGKKQFTEQTEWSLCLSDRVVLLRQDEERGFLYHRTLLPSTSPKVSMDDLNRDTERWLRDYLNLDVPLEALYQEWTEKDKVFARYANRFSGLRMLRQDPWECLCAFICSSNNNIARIGQMVQNLCTHFSPELISQTYPACPIEPEDAAEEEAEEVKPTSVTISYHPFPSPEILAREGVEEKLRDLGFGYRAKYIARTAQMLCEKHTRLHTHMQETKWDYGIKLEGSDNQDTVFPPSPAASVSGSPKKRRRINVKDESPDLPDTPPNHHSVRSYLQSLRQMTYLDARQELLQFPGIGPKVADCILLMSLDQASSIPVDRHVFQFAERWYHIRTKRYEEIAQKFRDLWGDYAGWAHSVLFTADLRSFADYKTEAKVEKQELLASQAYPSPPASQESECQSEEPLQDDGTPDQIPVPVASTSAIHEVTDGSLAERIKRRPKRKTRT